MSKWVSTWGIPTSYNAFEVRNLICDTTFRYVFYNMLEGDKCRLRFSNILGESDAKLDEVYLAEWAGNETEIVENSGKKVTFTQNGNVIKAGHDLVSDEIDYKMTVGKSYVVSIYIKDVTNIDCGYGRYYVNSGAPFNQTHFARGNHVNDTSFTLENRKGTGQYAFFNSVDVLTSDDSGAIVAFGDSITARPWPDYLSRRIVNSGVTTRSVVRKAIGGNRVLRDYQNYYEKRSHGLSAIRRIDMDLSQTPGVDTVIMLEGTNDLYHPSETSRYCPLDQMPTVEELIDGYKFCCDVAHKHGAKFILATIIPSAWMLSRGHGREEIRLAVNEWIRNNDYIDSFIDFDAVARDENNRGVMSADFDCGDKLHPGENGSIALANAVPESIITNGKTTMKKAGDGDKSNATADLID